MRKILLVARREYAETIKTRAFLIGVMFTPLMIVGIIFLTKMMDKKSETEVLPVRQVIVSDPAGELTKALQERIAQHNQRMPNQPIKMETLLPYATAWDTAYVRLSDLCSNKVPVGRASTVGVEELTAA